MHVDITIYIAQKCARASRRDYAYALTCQMPKGMIGKVVDIGRCMDGIHMATVRAITEALNRMRKSCSLHIRIEDVFVKNMIEKNLSSWAAAGFEDSRGKKKDEKWQELWHALARHEYTISNEVSDEYKEMLHNAIKEKYEIKWEDY